MQIRNIEDNKQYINNVVLSVYENINKGTNQTLINFFSSDCAMCKNVLFQYYEEIESFSIECILTNRHLTHEMTTDEDGNIIYVNLLANKTVKCSQCQKVVQEKEEQ